MNSEELTIIDLRNIVSWHETAKGTDAEQQSRTYLKITGALAIVEDFSEPLVSELIGTTLEGFQKASPKEMQYVKSILAIRIARLNAELKVLHITQNVVRGKQED